MKRIVPDDMMESEQMQPRSATMKRGELLLKNHPYEIWEASNGRWYTYLPDPKKKRKQISRAALNDLNKAIIDYWENQKDNPTIDEVFDDWIERKLSLNKISKATYTRYKQVYNRHFASLGTKQIRNIDEGDISDFMEEEVYRCNLTRKGYSALKIIVKGFMKRAKKIGYINYRIEDVLNDIDVTDFDFAQKSKPINKEVFTDEELGKIIPYLRQNDDITNLGLLLIFATGIRVGELVTLTNEDIYSNIVHVHATETRYRLIPGEYHYEVKDSPKTQAGDREVIVPDEYLWILKKIRTISQFDKYLFMYNGHRMHTKAFRDRLKKVCDKLEIVPKSPHKIRKTYASILLDSGVDKQLIINQMGHTDISCTEHFYHKDRKSKEEKARIINSIDLMRSIKSS